MSDEYVEFDLSKIDFGLSDKAKDIIKMLDTTTIIIEQQKQRYEEFVNTMIRNMLYGFEHKEFRDQQVMYKFFDDKNEEVKLLPFRHFIINAIFWYPQIQLDYTALNDGLIIPSPAMNKMSGKFIKGYMDTMYVIPYKKTIDNHSMNEIICDTMYLLSRISRYFNPFFGLSINVEVFRDLANRIPEYNELLNFRLDETKQPAEIEKDAADAANRQLDLLLNDPKFNILKPLLATRAAKDKQFAEVETVIGLKPNVDGRTLPKPINHNFITGNNGNIPDYYVNNISGRKAAIINNEFMGTAGHLLILVAILTSASKLSKRINDCGTPNAVPIMVKDKKVLSKINGRRYHRGGQTNYETINAALDEDLIGERIWMRSPITCCSKDGCICAECYGDLYYTNKDLHSAGTFAAFEVMNPVVQGLLSAKHFQGTNSSMINFGEEFDQFFTISATDIILNSDIEDVETYTLVIKREDLHSSDSDEDDDTPEELGVETTPKRGRKKKIKIVEEEDEFGIGDEEDSGEAGLRLTYYTTRFYVVKNLYNKKQKEIFEFEDVDKKELFMHNDMILRLMMGDDPDLGNFYFINLEDISLDEFIFLVEVENNELTKPMKRIEKLIDNKNHEGCNTYDEMAQTMIDLIIQSGLSATSVHAEMIIRGLVRDVNNQVMRPDFTKLIMRQDYEILTIKTALKKDKSITTSLSTPFLKYQLISMTETFEKNATSDFDLLFKRYMSDDPWKDDSIVGYALPKYAKIQDDVNIEEVTEWSK